MDLELFEQFKNNTEQVSFDEFKIMREASVYKSLQDPFGVLKNRPVGLQGETLTDDQIVTYFDRYGDTILHPDDFSIREIEFLKDCYDWCFKAMKTPGYREVPYKANGEPMSNTDISEYAEKYYKLQEKNPVAFALFQKKIKQEKNRK